MKHLNVSEKSMLCPYCLRVRPSSTQCFFSPQLIINEAAAQFCMRDNALLLRRVELFSLARQVARKCAYTSTLKHAR